MASAFGAPATAGSTMSAADIEKLHAKIELLVIERNSCRKPPVSSSALGRQKAVKKEHPGLGVRQQCGQLSLTRSSVYYQPCDESAENLALLAIIDRQFLETPW